MAEYPSYEPASMVAAGGNTEATAPGTSIGGVLPNPNDFASVTRLSAPSSSPTWLKDVSHENARIWARSPPHDS